MGRFGIRRRDGLRVRRRDLLGVGPRGGFEVEYGNGARDNRGRNGVHKQIGGRRFIGSGAKAQAGVLTLRFAER